MRPPIDPLPGFPYMRFARGPAMNQPHSLTQSGMPAADPALFGAAGALDLAYAGADALPRLEETLAARYGVPRERVFVAPGASGAMAVVAAALFRPGVRVAVEVPSYEPLRVLPRRAGAEVREIRRTHAGQWRLDPDAAGAALAGARRGHVFLTTPHNPSGFRSSPADLRALARHAADAGGYLVSNEIYEEFVEPGRAVRAATLVENGISIGSLTKAYGLSGLRLGWVVLGERAAAEREAFEDAVFLQLVDLPTTSLRAGRFAFEHREALIAPYARILAESKPVFERWLGQEPRLRVHVPADGLIAFAEVPGVPDTLALSRHLARAEQLAVVPGEFFGAPGHLRLGFGSPPERLSEALARLSRGLESYTLAPQGRPGRLDPAPPVA
ncbi:MAG: pyridoxal phosphate-dependent aminotransferase [Planctomycetota bacterium]|nr:pyridoxal phosphate-dependent aminotransferase [Planctomycetota bacterium]